MLSNVRAGLIAAVVLAVSGCGTQGGWMGADAEKVYDKELEAKRLASVLNNDEYYQLYQENRIYVISDAKDFSGFVKLGELTRSVTKIGGGPKGERLIFSINGTEAKAMEAKVGFKGGAQEMYEGNRKGLAKGFFGVLVKDGRYVVTDSWDVAEGFRGGVAPAGGTAATAPDGKPVVYVSKEDPTALKARFEKLFG